MNYVPYLAWILPLVSALTWLATLITMLVVWNREGKPHYTSFNDNQTIAYISDIGAQGLKPLFITGCTVTCIFLDLSFVTERWLRHKGILARNVDMIERIFSVVSIVFAVVGSVGLICLSIFDTLRHPSLHRLFLFLFMLGYLVSAICICGEYQRLGVNHRDKPILRMSFWVKLTFVLVEFALAVGFAVCLYKRIPNPGAILEWAISFIFTFYILSFRMDLWPALHMRRGDISEDGMIFESNSLRGSQRTHNNNGSMSERPFARPMTRTTPRGAGASSGMATSQHTHSAMPSSANSSFEHGRPSI